MKAIRISARDRRRAAIHEAGHVVVANHISRQMGSRSPDARARIFPNRTADPRTEKTWLGNTNAWIPMTALDRRMLGLAGYAAECIWDGDGDGLDPDLLWGDQDAMSPTDWAMAGCEPGEPDDLCCEAIAELEALLARDGALWRELLLEARRLIEYSREAVTQPPQTPLTAMAL